MDKKLKIAIIGYGGMGGYHTRLLADSGKFELSGIYDIDPARCAAARKNGIKVYSSKEEIARDPQTDAVLIATPNDFHMPYAVYFAANKKHIVCEKPAALTAAEFDKMTGAAVKNGVRLVVHQNRRQDRDYVTALEIVKSGVIGDVYRIDSRVTGANGIPGGWRKLIKHGGGMMLDWGVHLLDQILIMPGFENPESLYCKYSYVQGHEAEDGFTLSLNYGGAEVNVEVLTGCYIETPRWLIFGSKGTARLDGFGGRGQITVRTDSDEEVVAQKLGNGFSKTMAVSPDSHREGVAVPIVSGDEGFFYRQFYDAAVNGKPHSIENAEVRRVLAIMEQAKKSAQSGKAVNLKLKT